MRRKCFGWVAILGCLVSAAGCGRQATSVESERGGPGTPGVSFKEPVVPAEGVAPGRRYALLVGCTKYDQLERRLWLCGGVNDVELMQQLLTRRFQFPGDGEHIRVLRDGDGAHGRPTRANIEREFQRLIELAGPDIQIVVLMSGHGSRQPGAPDPDYPQPDGHDGIFLPADVGPWNGDKQAVTNAIVDRELRAWTKAITAKGAKLWVILDACCSAMTLRGTGEDAEERLRQVLPKDLGIPEELQKQAEARGEAAAERTRGGLSQARFALAPPSPNFVATYAAQYDQLTPESRMPPDRKSSDQRYGMFTYALCETLGRDYAQPLTYAELVREVHAQYRRWGRTWGPTPLVEGLGQDTEVLGLRQWPRRSQIEVQPDGEGWKITAGRLMGLMSQSVLAVYPPVTDANPDRLLGYVRIKESDTLEATIEPCRYQVPNQPAAPELSARDLKAGQRCRVVRLEYGSLRLPIAVDETLCSAPNKSRLQELRKQIEELARQPEAMFSLVDLKQQPKWVIQERKDTQDQQDKLFLLSKDVAEVTKDPPADVPQFPIAANLSAEQLKQSLEQIARVTNLLGLTRPAIGGKAAAIQQATDSSLHVEIKMVRLRDKHDPKGEEIKSEGRELTFAPGELVGWRVINRSSLQADVSLLFIDSQFKIQLAYPRAGGGTGNRLPKDADVLAAKAYVTKDTIGAEHMVMIAVRPAGDQPYDFGVLTQPTLALARGQDATRGPGQPSVLDSPLGALLQAATYGAGSTRGLAMVEVSDSDLRLVSWRVRPQPDK